MAELLINILNSETKENKQLFNNIRAKLFQDYAGKNNKMNKKQAKKALIELSNMMYNEIIDNESLEILYNDIDTQHKGYLNKKDFTGMTRCFLISLIQNDIDMSDSLIKIDLLNEDDDLINSFIIGGGGKNGEE